MRHRVVGKKLNRDKDHREALMRNLASSLFIHGKIETTLTKAKFIRSFAEKLITRAKDNSYNSLRILRSRLGNEVAIRKLLSEIAPSFKDRNGGYTRIQRTGVIRKGDNSELAYIELVSKDLTSEKAEVVKEEEEK